MKRDPLYLLVKSMINGMIVQSANAENPNEYPRSYFLIMSQGGYNGWTSICGLQDVANNPVQTHAVVRNKFNTPNYSGSLGDLAYGHYLWNSTSNNNQRPTYLPAIWETTIPTRSGGSAPMTSVLNNALIFRGTSMQADVGHDIGRILVPQPDLSKPSVTGIAADKFVEVSRYLAANSQMPLYQIPAFAQVSANVEQGLGYNSASGTGLYVARGRGSYATWLHKLLGGFSFDNPAINLNNKALMEQYISAALQELGDYHKSGKPGAANLYDSYRNAEDLFRRSFGNLTDQWNALYAKYLDLAKRAAASVPYLIPAGGTDPNSAGLSHMATEFALMEFIRSNDLVGVTTFHRPGTIDTGTFTHDLDEHTQEGRNMTRSVVAMNYWMRMVVAMINEFRTAVGATRWEDTVVQLGTEFGREPRFAHTDGSEHGPDASHLLAFSGAIQEFQYGGNVQKNTQQTTNGTTYNQGCYGRSIPVQYTNDVGQLLTATITNEHMASTIARLVGVPSPVTAASLVEQVGATFKLRTESPKTV